jgi:carbamoyl-phosphate synthase large subunit
MTLSDEAYQELRDAAVDVIRAVGVECGGSNIQFARERDSGEIRVIEMNPRVSRSSALASKATGYPIAKVAAKLAVGYTLDEIPNDLTGTTPASFEPTLDYVVVKAPRFAFEKFPGAETELGTQMKSVGEAMGIGRTFTEAFLKALRSRELDSGAVTPWAELDAIPEGVHPWFRRELDAVRNALARVHSLDDLVADDWLKLKRLGLSDADLAAAAGADEATARAKRRAWGVRPVYRRVDSCAGEVEAGSNYLYSTWGEADEATPDPGRSVVILGSGPNRIGQGIEFDYCCVHAAKTFRELGYEAVMVNCNPETVSTDYDTSDRLYFEPLGVEEVLAVCERERPAGVVTQFGGQTPLKLAHALEAAGFRVFGTSPEAIDLAEDRERFGALLDRLDIRCPAWDTAETAEEAVAAAERIGYPVLVRPSYVLGGRAMRVCYGPEEVAAAMAGAQGRVLLDRFLEQALELDVDALCDGEDTYVAAVMQHVEEAGVHSGDSACVLPPPSLSPLELTHVQELVRELGAALGVVGLLNVQLAIAEGELYVLEVNPRASRTVPFASKASGINLVAAACRLAAGANLGELGLPADPTPAQVSVKAAVLPFGRFPGADPVLGPEMRATGEVMATAADFPTAFAKAERAAGRALPSRGTAFISVCDGHKQAIVAVAHALAGLGFDLVATAGTAHALAAAGLAVDYVRKVTEAGDEPTVVDLIRRGKVDLVVNTPQGSGARTDGYLIREAALVSRVPCITTISGAAAAVEAIAHAQPEISVSLQERISEARAS